MAKATRRSAVLLGLMALGMTAASIPGFAEVQNVKVGGDVTVRTFHRHNMDLRAGDDSFDVDNFIMTTTGLNVGADLTENVSAFVRLANERDWQNQATGTETGSDVDISQAYVTLKELFYSPLTVRIGAQPIKWGRGFVLGSNLLPSVLSSVGSGDDRNASITANEFTDFTSFDAIRATLDLSGVAQIGFPLTLDYVYIKLDENNVTQPDDVNLQGVNFSTKFDAWNSELEAYYLNKRDRARQAAVDVGDGSVNTFGVRGSVKPVEGALVWSELAIQGGRRAHDIDGGGVTAGDTSHQAWAYDLGAEYTWNTVKTTPKFGGEWIFTSGKDLAQGVGTNGAVIGWDPIATSYFPTLIRAYQTRHNTTGLYPVDQTQVTSAFTNQNQLALFGGFKLDDLNVDSRLTWFRLPVGTLPPTVPAGNPKRKSYLGAEWDTWVTYDYTDDVQFGVTYGIFFPGPVFRDGGVAAGTGALSPCTTASTTCFGDARAQELITTVSVKF